jgi:hypothetical protein
MPDRFKLFGVSPNDLISKELFGSGGGKVSNWWDRLKCGE